MKIPFLAWLLQGIPESIAIASIAVTLATGILPWKKIVRIGLLQAVSAYILRLIPFTPGVHVILLITTLAVFMMIFTKENIKLSVIASSISLCLLLVIEALFHTSLFALNIVNPNDLMNNTIYRIMIGYPQVVLLFLISFILSKKGWAIGKFIKGLNYF